MHRFGGPEPDNYPMMERIARERMGRSEPADGVLVPREDLRAILKAVSELGVLGRTTLENINWCKATLKKHLGEK